MYVVIEIGEGRMTGGMWASVTATCQAASTIPASPSGRLALLSVVRPLDVAAVGPAMIAPVSVPVPVDGNPLPAMVLTRSRCRARREFAKPACYGHPRS